MRKLTWKDFEALAINLKVTNGIKDRMLNLFGETQELIYRSFLGESTKDQFVELIEERSRVLTKES